MVTPKVIEVLDLVNSDDPVLAREGLLEDAKLRRFCRQPSATDTVSGLTSREQLVELVV